MKLIGLMPVRNEDWILGCSLRAALKWCDAMVVLAHCCTDNSLAIIDEISNEHPNRVIVMIRPSEDKWPEMEHRQKLLDVGRAVGGTHFALVDADEVLTAQLLHPWNNFRPIRDEIESLHPGCSLHVGMLCMWRSLFQVRVDGNIWAKRYDLSLAFADAAHLTFSQPGYDHHQREPIGTRVSHRLYCDAGVMHLQWASWRRMQAKHAWYKCIERLKYPDKAAPNIDRIYSMASDEQGLKLRMAPDEWWGEYRDLIHHVKLEAVPWHEEAVRKMIEQHGREHFAGLDLYGL